MVRDTLFFSPQRALEVAKQKNILTNQNNSHPYMIYLEDLYIENMQVHLKDIQICYYIKEKLKGKDIPKNCIYLDKDNLVDFFKSSNLRFPQLIDFEGTNFSEEEKQNIVANFRKIWDIVYAYKKNRYKEYAQKIKTLKPNFNEKLRFFLSSSRFTTVMQYVSKDIASSLKRMGFKVKFVIEKNEFEICSHDYILKELYLFNPHIIININHFNNSYLNDYIYNFVWFQDAMPILTNNEKIYLRDRDFIFCYVRYYKKLLLKKGVDKNKIFIQDIFPVDESKFFLDKKIKKEDKIVFVGSFYDRAIPYVDSNIDYEVSKMIHFGEVPTIKRLDNLFKKYNIKIDKDKKDFVYNEIWQGYIRNITVKWLSEINDIKVEIYGYNWDRCGVETIVSKYKGVAQKDKLKDIYNSAKYALSSSGEYINTQRLGELVYCGAIPVVYDSRQLTKEKKTWDDECLYFKTKQELEYILKNRLKPKKYMSKKIIEHFSYKKFIKKILKIARLKGF